MVRPKFPHAPNGFYHVTLRGNRKEAIFRTDADRRLFEWLLHESIERARAEVHAYCWMPNHVHLLARIGELPIHRLVQHFAARYATRFNEAHDTVGHLFQGRYWAGLVDTDAYLLSTVRYIHRNPVASSLAPSPGSYVWSSHRAYLGTTNPAWLTTQFVLGCFDEDAAQARELLARFVDDERDCQQDAFVALQQHAERRFHIKPHALTGTSRDPTTIYARAWVAYYATRELGMDLIDIAARLGRSPRTLSIGIDTWIGQIRDTPPDPRRVTH